MGKGKQGFDSARYIQCALELLNIGMWQVSLEEASEIEDHDLAAGVCSTNPIYRYSEITIRDDVTDEDELRSILLHEVLHIPHAAIDHVVQERIIGENITKYKKVARLNKDYTDAMEPFIVIMTEALRPFVDAMYDKPKPTKKVTKAT